MTPASVWTSDDLRNLLAQVWIISPARPYLVRQEEYIDTPIVKATPG